MASDVQDNESNTDDEPLSPTTSDERTRVLDAVAGAVGVIIADHDINKERTKIRGYRITDGRLNVASVFRSCCGTDIIERCSGVVVINNDGPLIITAAHCISTNSSVLRKTRLITGLRDIDGRFKPPQVVAATGLFHFEDENDRDLAILGTDRSSAATAFPLPDETLDFNPKDRQELFIVGHAGGRDMNVYKGVVASRNPGQLALGARAIKVHSASRLPGLSGAPVFAFFRDTPTLIGIVQGGNARKRWLGHKIDEITKGVSGEDAARQKRLLDVIYDAIRLSELVSTFGVEGSALSRKLLPVFEKTGCSPLLPDPTAEDPMFDLLRRLLLREMPEQSVDQIIELFFTETPDAEAGTFANVTLLRGALSRYL